MINKTFSIISEPNRFQIIEFLRFKPLSVNELVSKLGIRQPQVSKHLKVLNDAGIVQFQQKAQLRVYSLEEEPFNQMDEWLTNFRKSWVDRLDRFGKHVQEK